LGNLHNQSSHMRTASVQIMPVWKIPK